MGDGGILSGCCLVDTGCAPKLSSSGIANYMTYPIVHIRKFSTSLWLCTSSILFVQIEADQHVRSSPVQSSPVSTFFPISEFSYFVIRF